MNYVEGNQNNGQPSTRAKANGNNVNKSQNNGAASMLDGGNELDKNQQN